MPRPKSRNGSTKPASRPTPRQDRTARTFPGTPVSGQNLPNSVSTAGSGTRATGGTGRAGLRSGLVMSGSWVLLGTWVCCRGSCGRSTRTRAPVLGASGSTKWMVPPWRSVTQRAMARPRPVPPPPSASASVPNRSKTRSRSEAGTPGPSSVTSSASRWPCPGRRPGRPHRRDCAGTRCRAGWRPQEPRRIGRGRQRGRRGADVVPHLATGHPRLGHGALQQRQDGHLRWTLEPRRRPPGRGRAGRRRGWRAARPGRAPSAGPRGPAATPSTRFSSTAHKAATGVRSSWLTFATSSRRRRSTAASSSAIRLKARASSPTSSFEVAVTRPE